MPKKVLHLRSSIGFYGAENVIINIAKETLGTEYYPLIGVFANTYNPHLEMAEVAKANSLQVKIVKCRGRIDVMALYDLYDYAKKNDISLLHAHCYKSNCYAYLVSRLAGIPVISTNHLWRPEDRKSKLYVSIDAWVMRRFPKLVAVSDEVKKTMMRKGISEAKIKTISNGIDLNKYSDNGMNELVGRLRNEFGIGEKDIVIGAAGRLVEQKGFNGLLMATAELIKTYPAVKTVIAGDGPLKDELQELAKELKIENRVLFPGARSDMNVFYRMADVFVLSSSDEGLPMVVLEAMAMSRPVVATRVGGVQKIMKDGETGLVVEPSNPRQLADAIKMFLDDRTFAMEVGRKGRVLIEEEFSSVRMAREYIQLYNDILETSVQR